MEILISNDDGYTAKGLQVLVELMRPYGHLTVVAPKYHQSGMSMACSMGLKPIAVKKLPGNEGEDWYYVDGTPATCVKFAIDNILPEKPDVVISGINHGANTATAVCYSGTIGAAQEGAVADILSIGVSLDSLKTDADFSPVKKFFPEILETILKNDRRKTGLVYNVNFPNIPVDEIKGVRSAHQGMIHWVREFAPYSMDFFQKYGVDRERMGLKNLPEPEDGEEVYAMVGDIMDDERNTPGCDHRLIREGYITVSVHNIDTTDYEELSRIHREGFIDRDFR